MTQQLTEDDRRETAAQIASLAVHAPRPPDALVSKWLTLVEREIGDVDEAMARLFAAFAVDWAAATIEKSLDVADEWAREDEPAGSDLGQRLLDAVTAGTVKR